MYHTEASEGTALPASAQAFYSPLHIAAQENKPECIAILAAAKANINGVHPIDSSIGLAAAKGSDESVRLLAYLGARFIEPASSREGRPFWRHFEDSTTRVRNPKVWEWIVSKGGDKGTEKSLQKRIKLLKKAGLEDPRDENSC